MLHSHYSTLTTALHSLNTLNTLHALTTALHSLNTLTTALALHSLNTLNTLHTLTTALLQHYTVSTLLTLSTLPLQHYTLLTLSLQHYTVSTLLTLLTTLDILATKSSTIWTFTKQGTEGLSSPRTRSENTVFVVITCLEQDTQNSAVLTSRVGYTSLRYPDT